MKLRIITIRLVAFSANLEVKNDMIGGVAWRMDGRQRSSLHFEGLPVDDLGE
jgi:hypothetical protein